MHILLIIFALCIALVIFVFLESYRELNKIKLTTYEISLSGHNDSDSKKDAIRNLRGKKLVFISDYHEAQGGRLNERIINLVNEFNPQYILLGGDMVNSNAEGEDGEILPAADLINKLSESYKVFYALGNHEKRCSLNYHESGKAWDAFKNSLDENVTFLVNDNFEIWDNVRVYGLDIPIKYYGRGVFPELDGEKINKMLGLPSNDEYNILLGHTPDFMKAYSQWGADLVLSGHFHGGILRFPFINRGLITPRLRPFADYVYGMKKMGNTTMLITNGIGQHSVKLKINNIPEVVGIVFK
ncbi:MAG: metallophosphoesterase [Eubacterium sp.]|nr:metallophosphoesterase [Eubacterium sp.]